MLKRRSLIWVGSSLKDLTSFPDAVKKDIGFALHLAQSGEKSNQAKPFKGIGSGIYEVVDDYHSDTYRAIYAVNLGDRVYVLHAFQKKSKKGIKTPQNEIDMIERRYKIALQLYQNDSKEI